VTLRRGDAALAPVTTLPPVATAALAAAAAAIGLMLGAVTTMGAAAVPPVNPTELGRHAVPSLGFAAPAQGGVPTLGVSEPDTDRMADKAAASTCREGWLTALLVPVATKVWAVPGLLPLGNGAIHGAAGEHVSGIAADNQGRPLGDLAGDTPLSTGRGAATGAATVAGTRDPEAAYTCCNFARLTGAVDGTEALREAPGINLRIGILLDVLAVQGVAACSQTGAWCCNLDGVTTADCGEGHDDCPDVSEPGLGDACVNSTDNAAIFGTVKVFASAPLEEGVSECLPTRGVQAGGSAACPHNEVPCCSAAGTCGADTTSSPTEGMARVLETSCEPAHSDSSLAAAGRLAQRNCSICKACCSHKARKPCSC